MRHVKILLPVLVLVLVYSGCQKSENVPKPSQTPGNNKSTIITIAVPEHVDANSIVTDSLITNFQQLAVLLAAAPAKTQTESANSPQIGGPFVSYDGYTKTYDCNTNDWTYVYTWQIMSGNMSSLAGSGSLTVGTFSASAPFSIVNETFGLGGTTFTIQYTIVVPNDANYCNSTTLQEMISYTYNMHVGPRLLPESGAASNSESADPNVYQTYPDVVGGFFANGDGTFELEVAPGVTVCGSACHISALGFPPTVTFYYHLVGSSSGWSSYSQPGGTLSGFNVLLNQAGTWEYYTQEETAPGVESGEIDYGTITVQ